MPIRLALRLSALALLVNSCGSHPSQPSRLADNTDTPGACIASDSMFEAAEGGCLHFETGLVWSARHPQAMLFAEANAYCAALDEGGFRNWTLGARSELVALSGLEKVGRHLPGQFADFFWSSVSSTALATAVNLLDSSVTTEDRLTFKAAVICRRKPADSDGDHVPDALDQCNHSLAGAKVLTTGPRRGCAADDVVVPIGMGCKQESNYFRSAQGGCQQLSNGLVWSLRSPETLPHRSVERYCDMLVEGFPDHQFSDWALPTSEQLVAIGGALARDHLPFTAYGYFWSGTTFEKGGVDGYAAYRLKSYRGVVSLGDATVKSVQFHESAQVTSGTKPASHFDINTDYALPVVCVRKGIVKK